ncbi:AimP [Bacillus phage z1a]|uniref:AimP n=1 Tax=Bacillus phage z1a TaxID=2767196 RepID=A0ACD3VMD9_9CAUD|nr:AimP [Bacillus phage z1a]UIE29673.1 AimP [Bacillus phage z1a]
MKKIASTILIALTVFTVLSGYTAEKPDHYKQNETITYMQETIKPGG